MAQLPAQPDAGAAAVAAARGSYGRLVAWLAWQWRDIAAAEDALGDAFALALSTWPRDGVPDAPEGWLLTVAKRRLLHEARRRRIAEDPALTVLWPGEDTPAAEPVEWPDDRLRLLFVCTHPAIAPAVRPALMLQVVLGVEAAQIAAACLVSPEAMTKRLVRAKAKIREAGIAFETPAAADLEARMEAVLEAIYGAYTLGRGTGAAVGDGPRGPDGADLAEEALYLAGLVDTGWPDVAEAAGLHALLLYAEARRPARLDPHGRFVPLDRQDPARWDAARIAAADACLARAAAARAPGPYQLEAAIQAAHCEARRGPVPWDAIVVLYERLLACAPTAGASIGHAIALARATGDPGAGLRRLEAIDADSVADHQPWWAARAALLADAGRTAEAVEAWSRAASLSSDPPLREFLLASAARGRGA